MEIIHSYTNTKKQFSDSCILGHFAPSGFVLCTRFLGRLHLHSWQLCSLKIHASPSQVLPFGAIAKRVWQSAILPSPCHFEDPKEYLIFVPIGPKLWALEGHIMRVMMIWQRKIGKIQTILRDIKNILNSTRLFIIYLRRLCIWVDTVKKVIVLRVSTLLRQ